MTSWLTDLRRVAFIAFVAATVALPLPVWNATRKLAATASEHPQHAWWIILTTIALYLFTAMLPAFYYALSRNQVTLHFPRSIRPLALASMVLTVIYASSVLPEVTKIVAYWTTSKMLDWGKVATFLAVARDPNTIGTVSIALNELSNLAYVLLLGVFFRQASDDGQTDTAAVSRHFRLVTKVAVIVWGMWFGFNVLRLMASPFVYIQIRNLVLQAGRPEPSYWSVAREIVWALLSSAGLFAAPYIVYRSLKRPTATAPAGFPR